MVERERRSRGWLLATPRRRHRLPLCCTSVVPRATLTDEGRAWPFPRSRLVPRTLSSFSSVSATSSSATARTTHKTACSDVRALFEDRRSATGALPFLRDEEDLLRSFVLRRNAGKSR